MRKNMKTERVLVGRDARNEIHDLFDQLFENCYIDALTGWFHCKKCDNAVHVDLARRYAFCPVHGMLI